MRRYSAWRFCHPDFDETGELTGLGVSPAGGIQMVEDKASIRQAILLLLSQIPGERVMRPDYGCDLHKLIFSPNDDTTAGLAIHYIREALNRWETRIDIIRLDAVRNESDPARLDVILDYRVKTTQQEDQITYPVILSGGQI